MAFDFARKMGHCLRHASKKTLHKCPVINGDLLINWEDLTNDNDKSMVSDADAPLCFCERYGSLLLLEHKSHTNQDAWPKPQKWAWNNLTRDARRQVSVLVVVSDIGDRAKPTRIKRLIFYNCAMRWDVKVKNDGDMIAAFRLWIEAAEQQTDSPDMRKIWTPKKIKKYRKCHGLNR